MKNLQKYYTRIIGLLFTLVIISSVIEIITKGHTPEAWHKIFHVLLGIIILKFAWNNEAWWKPFCLANGALFTFIAAFGFVFPNFAGLDAFNLTDTILHSIVGISGLLIGLLHSEKI